LGHTERPRRSWLGKIRLRRQRPENRNTQKPLTRKARSKSSSVTADHGPVEITTLKDFERYWNGLDDDTCLEHSGQPPQRDYVALLKRLSVRGDTQIIGSKEHPEVVHPVVKLLHERRRVQMRKKHHPSEEVLDETETNNVNDASIATDSLPEKDRATKALNDDGNKVALVVEGGGMRGCVSAGMVCALHHLGLQDTIDVVYGASAGAVVAAYFVSQQVPWFGPEVYYDQLTTAGDKFIDLKRLLRSLGFGLVDPRLLKDVLTRPENGKPLLNLNYLVDQTMQEAKPLDFETFKARQAVQPLKVVATGLTNGEPVVLSQESGHLDTLEDLCSSLRASCLLPGIAGPVMNALKDMDNENEKPKFVLRNNYQSHCSDGEAYEPLGDAMLSSPIPYDIALKDGATHVVVIRSSPDGENLMAGTAAKSMWESLIFRRFFLRKNRLPKIFKMVQLEQRHQKTYASSILELNEAAKAATARSSNGPHIMTIALEPGSVEVSHLETTREAIFEGVRQGFARAYDTLVQEPALRGQGYEVARVYFPDEILDYDPQDIASSSREEEKYMSAFESYLQILETKR
ncbi:MAG: hypothetical protein SGILL_002917, partial [Bacillariaceae sp.]